MREVEVWFVGGGSLLMVAEEKRATKFVHEWTRAKCKEYGCFRILPVDNADGARTFFDLLEIQAIDVRNAEEKIVEGFGGDGG
jgi:hypothetical protein